MIQMNIFMNFLSDNLHTVLIVLALVIAVLIFFYFNSSSILKKNTLSLSIKEREGVFSKDSKKTRDERMVMFLARNGVNYHFKRIVRPREYRSVKFIIGLGCTILIILLTREQHPLLVVVYALLAFAFGYYVPDFWFWGNNKDDNKKMLKDIRRIYDTIRIRLKVDQFLNDILEECYRGASSSRLKRALYELNEGLKNNSSPEFEIESFRNKFDNPFIDQLANAINMYFKTGNADAMMSDLTEQMLAIDHALNMRHKERLETVSMFLEVAVLVGMIGGIMVVLFHSLGGMIDGLM